MDVVGRGWATCPNKAGRKAGVEAGVVNRQVFRGRVRTAGKSGCEQLCNYEGMVGPGQ